jgi:hypothetical protein
LLDIDPILCGSGFYGVVEGTVEEEIADAIIRLCDLVRR